MVRKDQTAYTDVGRKKGPSDANAYAAGANSGRGVETTCIVAVPIGMRC